MSNIVKSHVPATRSDHVFPQSSRPRLAIAIVMALSVLVALSDSARAGTEGGYCCDGVNIRTGPATTYTSLGLGYSSQGACIYDQVVGETINGDSNWDYHTNTSTSVTGYSADYYMTYIVPFVNC